MGLLAGKTGVIMGIANQHSIASACATLAHSEGATIGFNHLPDKDGKDRMEKRARAVVDPLNPFLVHPCDVTDDQQLKDFFEAVRAKKQKIDFFVHSIAFASAEEIKGPTVNASRAGFLQAMEISVYSFIACAKLAADLMTDGGSILTMTYFGGEKVVSGYNLMGVCKSALDSAVRYLAYDLGPRNIRVNGLSAGPIKTLAAVGIGNFNRMLDLNARTAPMGRNVTTSEVAQSAVYLLSPWSQAVTGELHHVDCGYNIMGSPNPQFAAQAES
jgi:enoyl-[acyl-carrier protein] reductase I